MCRNVTFGFQNAASAQAATGSLTTASISTATLRPPAGVVTHHRPRQTSSSAALSDGVSRRNQGFVPTLRLEEGSWVSKKRSAAEAKIRLPAFRAGGTRSRMFSCSAKTLLAITQVNQREQDGEK